MELVWGCSFWQALLGHCGCCHLFSQNVQCPQRPLELCLAPFWHLPVFLVLLSWRSSYFIWPGVLPACSQIDLLASSQTILALTCKHLQCLKKVDLLSALEGESQSPVLHFTLTVATVGAEVMLTGSRGFCICSILPIPGLEDGEGVLSSSGEFPWFPEAASLTFQTLSLHRKNEDYFP